MKLQLQREAHARNEKVLKPDYREEIALDGDDFDRGGISRKVPKEIFSVKGNSIWIDTSHPDYKTDAQRHLENILRHEFVFKVRGYVARMGCSLKKFREYNADAHKVKAVDNHLPGIHAELKELFSITVKNLRRAEREGGPDHYVECKVASDGRKKLAYKFKSGLVPYKIGKLETKDFILDIDFINAEKPSAPE